MRRLALASIVTAALVATACSVPRPPGDGALRYRDQVFGSVNVTRDVTYGSAPDSQGNAVDLKLDVYQPAGDAVARRPALVWVHGGGFTAGDKSSGASKSTYFAKLGYVVVSINYRLLSPTGCGGDPDPTPVCENAALGAQHDAQAAVRFLRRHADTYGVDPDRIAIGGGSAGAVTSLLVNWRSEDPGDSGNPGFSSKVRAAVSQSGGAPTNEYIDAGDSPAIFFHGTEDQTVFYHWAVSNAGAMYNAGIFTVLHPFEGAGHGLAGSYAAVMNEQSTYFLFFAMDLANAAR
jgi:acetyl esterase/lipase